MERMRANPKVREWWAMTDGMQVCEIPSLFSLSLTEGVSGFAVLTLFDGEGESNPWGRG